jgi:ABC-type branched-subunit amino acid transport system ATPase component
MTQTILAIQNLHAGVEGREILKGIDLTIRVGETHALMGPVVRATLSQRGGSIIAARTCSNSRPKSAPARGFFWRFNIRWKFPA